MPAVALHIGGAVTAAAGAAVAAAGWLKGSEARRLESAVPLARIADARDLEPLPALVTVAGTAWAEHPLACELADRQAVMVQASGTGVVRWRSWRGKEEDGWRAGGLAGRGTRTRPAPRQPQPAAQLPPLVPRPRS